MMGRTKRRTPLLAATPAIALAALLSCGDAVGPLPDEFDDPRTLDLAAIVDVNVVRPEIDRIDREQTVLIQDGRITWVGDDADAVVPPGAEVIDGRDRYLTPGLVDMHVHMTASTLSGLRSDYRLFLANGVTTVRLMWGFQTALGDRGFIEDGRVLGPSMMVASPGIDGPGGTWTGSTPPVTTPAEARNRVLAHFEEGYDFIKVYNDLSPALYDAVIEEADRLGIPVVGHVPGQVGLERVQRGSQQTAEHFIGFKLRALLPGTGFNGGELDWDQVRLDAAASAREGLWHTPTITVDALSRSRVERIRDGAELARVSPGMRNFFENGFHNGLPDGVAARERENHERMMREIVAAGGRLLVGTDAGFGWIVPGFSIHDELAGFVRAGLSPATALTAATAGPADATGNTTEFGRIQPGARADLLLVTQNPLEDIGALQLLSGVVAQGRWLHRDDLRSMTEPR